MAIHFVDIVKRIIKEKNLEDLTSMGWSRMRQVERDLASGKIDKDGAIKEFLKERDFELKLNRHDLEDIEKMFK
jgi:hypothetical protein